MFLSNLLIPKSSLVLRSPYLDIFHIFATVRVSSCEFNLDTLCDGIHQFF